MGNEKNTIKAAKSQTHEAKNVEVRQGHLADRYVRTHTPESDDPDDESDN
ncbi:hypothetical protein OHB04_22940 [Streptomyces sp. NBC_01775]|nr:hypothetical protein [Streptomyces sp. NBC_01775]WSB78350.1 hypothetical protein OHB04_22940 [Streptomyces sp. NBC_01775]